MNKKVSLVKAIKSMPRIIKKSFVSVILFELIYKGLIFVIFKPLLNFLVFLFMRLAGYTTIINDDLVPFLTSIPGIFMVLLIVFISVLIVYFEHAVLTTYIFLGTENKKAPFLYGVTSGFAMMDSLKSVSSIGFAIYSLGLLPVISFGFTSSLLPSIQIPNYIIYEAEKKAFAPFLIILGVLLAIALIIRLAFTIPAMTLENKKFFGAAKRSFKLSEGNTIKIGVFTLVSLIITTLVYILIAFLAGLLAKKTNILVSPFLLWIFNIISSPFTLMVNLSLYHQLAVGEAKLDKEKIEHTGIKLLNFTSSAKYNIMNVIKGVWAGIVSVFKKIAPLWLKERPYILLVLIIPIIAIIGRAIQTQMYTPFNGIPVVAGHRGSLDGVENTIEAIDSAINQGAGYVEIDVLLSKDNVPMVIHDSNLSRLAGNRVKIYDKTSDELKEYTLKQNGYEGHISTLDEICKYTKDKVKLIIELKIHNYENASVVDETVKVVEKYNLENSALVMSSEQDLLDELNVKYEYIHSGYVVIGKVGHLSKKAVEKMNVDFLAFEDSLITKSNIKLCQRSGKEVFVWTVNEYDRTAELVNMKVNGIITDYPDMGVKAVEKLKEKEIAETRS